MANRRGSRLGTGMSVGTLARAAFLGHRLEISSLTERPVVITGYLVGMDDFHLRIVEVPFTTTPASVALVHKSAGLIRISAEPMLESEPEATREEIVSIGERFWDFCGRRFLGNGGNKESQ